MKCFIRIRTAVQIIAICAAIALSATPGRSQVELTSFGSAAFTVDPGSTTSPYSQTVSGIVFGPTITFADTLGGSFASTFNWSTYNPFTAPPATWFVKMSISGANPNLPFTLNLVNSVGGTLVNFDGDTSALSGGYVPLTLSTTDPGVASALSAIDMAQFTWNNGAAGNVTLEGVAAVPEPSTYVLLALGGLALGGYAMRRRQRA
jgi:hypothetical protein